MRDIHFELCAETLVACLAGRDGGAARIELCSRLDLDGLSPAPSLAAEAIALCGVPVHAMIRTRAGDFVYSETDFVTMQSEILHMKRLGAAGVVFGLLHLDATVDIERSRILVALARPMKVTFHRAFDRTSNLARALEDVIASGCDRVLTSGGEADVVAGAANIAALVAQAGDRIAIAAGGGLRLGNAAAVARISRATHFHASLRCNGPIDPANVRALIQALSSSV